jgi:nicotinamidase/pyrazinamidase
MFTRRLVLTGLGRDVSRCPRSIGALGRTDQADDASALLVIDVQNCFLPGGSLAVKDGEQVVPSSTASQRALPMW